MCVHFVTHATPWLSCDLLSVLGGLSLSLMLHSICECHHVHLYNRGICNVRAEKVSVAVSQMS